MTDARIPVWLAQAPVEDFADVVIPSQCEATIRTYVTAGKLRLFGPHETDAALALVRNVWHFTSNIAMQRTRCTNT